MIGMSRTGWRWRAAEALWCFRSARRASALESVCSLCFVVAILGGVVEIVKASLVSDILHRAARAVARDNSMQDWAAGTREELLGRAWEAIRAEVGDRLNPDLVRVDIDVFDNPSTMLRGELSEGENVRLGGDAGDMVVVRLRFRPRTPLDRMRQELLPDDFAYHAVAVARNERIVSLSTL